MWSIGSTSESYQVLYCFKGCDIEWLISKGLRVYIDSEYILTFPLHFYFARYQVGTLWGTEVEFTSVVGRIGPAKNILIIHIICFPAFFEWVVMWWRVAWNPPWSGRHLCSFRYTYWNMRFLGKSSANLTYSTTNTVCWWIDEYILKQQLVLGEQHLAMIQIA